MFSEVPLQTNFYNFTQSVFLGGRNYVLRFVYSDRIGQYIMDILDDNNQSLDSGLACAINVQLNRRIVHIMRGVLFFASADKTLSYAERLTLGTKVKLFYYLPV